LTATTAKSARCSLRRGEPRVVVVLNRGDITPTDAPAQAAFVAFPALAAIRADMRSIRLYNIEVPVDAGDKAFYRAVLRRIGFDRSHVESITMTSRALDARGHNKGETPRWNCTADVVLLEKFEADITERLKGFKNLVETPVVPGLDFPSGTEPLQERPVVVGSGPGGLLAAYVLAKHGYRPLVIERGVPALERLRQIGKFNSGNAPIDPEANTSFGEGGAGTFSDGKLYTRKNKDPYLTAILRLLVEHGAPDEILLDAAPHIGTDKLAPVVVRLREAVEKLGGEVRFRAKLTGIQHEGGKLTAVIVNGERIPTHTCILATGHSARDVYEMLRAEGVPMEAKPFQFGVRIEHPQDMVDQWQLGKFAGKFGLGAAEYFLTCAINHELPEIHSFCMCPGGMIVPAVDTDGELCLNGMSFSLRNMKWANAGLVTTITPADLPNAGPLAGVEFQRHYERKAFQAGGGDFMAPAQTAGDFLAGIVMKRDLEGSYPRGRKYTELSTILPERYVKGLAYALRRFESSMPGFAGSDGVIHAVESRASSPVRVTRDPESRQSPGMAGLYPVGEGAGFAGGIMSAALDGVHSAAALMAAHGVPSA
jgi:uncharacterized FAD-dependent dehydrogenase